MRPEKIYSIVAYYQMAAIGTHKAITPNAESKLLQVRESKMPAWRDSPTDAADVSVAGGTSNGRSCNGKSHNVTPPEMLARALERGFAIRRGGFTYHPDGRVTTRLFSGSSKEVHVDPLRIVPRQNISRCPATIRNTLTVPCESPVEAVGVSLDVPVTTSLVQKEIPSILQDDGQAGVVSDIPTAALLIRNAVYNLSDASVSEDKQYDIMPTPTAVLGLPIPSTYDCRVLPLSTSLSAPWCDIHPSGNETETQDFDNGHIILPGTRETIAATVNIAASREGTDSANVPLLSASRGDDSSNSTGLLARLLTCLSVYNPVRALGRLFKYISNYFTRSRRGEEVRHAVVTQEEALVVCGGLGAIPSPSPAHGTSQSSATRTQTSPQSDHRRRNASRRLFFFDGVIRLFVS